jgi:hypothetical protein
MSDWGSSYKMRSVHRQWTCPKCARTIMVSHSGYMYSSDRAAVSARLASNLMKKRIQHKQAGCQKDNASGSSLFKVGVAAVGLYALTKVFS